MKKYNFLNIIRFIMAIIVVANHLHPFDFMIGNNIYINNLYNFVIQFAVPFFFISTGFFIGKKISNLNKIKDNESNYIKKRIKSDIRTYIIFTLIYLPITIYGFLYNDKNVIQVIYNFIRGVFFVGENFNSWILWYLLSEIYGLAFIYQFLQKNKKFEKLIYIGLSFFLFGIFLNYFNKVSFTNEYITLIQKVTKSIIPNGRIFYSLIFIPFGMKISKSKQKNNFKIIILLIPLIILNSAFTNEFISKISLLLCSLILFICVISIDYRNEKVSDVLNFISKDLYFWHLYVWSILSFMIDGYIHLNYGLNYFIYTIVIIFIISLIHYKLRNNMKLIMLR